MEKLITYVDVEFLKAFYSCKPAADDVFDPTSRTWYDLYDFLLRNTTVVVLASLDVVRKEQTFVLDLISRGKFDVQFDAQAAEVVLSKVSDGESVSPHLAFFMDALAVDERSAVERIGLLVTNSDSVFALWERAGRSTEFSISDGNHDSVLRSWHGLRHLRLPRAEFVIADHYLFYKQTEGITNVVELIDALLPEGGEKQDVYISIITDLEGRSGKMQRLAESIRSQLNGERPNCIFDVSLVTPRRPFHDRHIITNYARFTSGHGFVCFSQSGASMRDTVLSYSPFFNHRNFQIAQEKLEALAAAVSNPKLAGISNSDGKGAELKYGRPAEVLQRLMRVQAH